MAVNDSRPVARRVHKGRVGGCLTILFILIFTISTIISGCTKKNSKKQKEPVVETVSSEQQVTTQQTEKSERKYIICIDPGHGGDDIGSFNGDRLEKVDNLRYATEVYEELSKREGVEVLITRTSNDVTMDNHERADFSNNANADLHLALHRNMSEDHTANGVEVWIQKEKEVVDEVLGFKLLKALEKVGIQYNRGVQDGFTNDSQENFQIIEYTNMPCCIVELGFISNDEDNRLFDAHHKEYASAIADVVIEMCKGGYLDKVDDNQ